MAWLETTGEYVRVVSTTSERLFDYVERGVFLDALYYRLNAVLVDLHDGQLWRDDSYESFASLL
jgi:transcriptional regulator of acetoin/glycerol metabolism